MSIYYSCVYVVYGFEIFMDYVIKMNKKNNT